MLPSSTNSAFATSGIGIFTLPMPVQTSTEKTEITPKTRITASFAARRLAPMPIAVPPCGAGAETVLLFMLF